MLKARLELEKRHLCPTFANTHAGIVSFDLRLDIDRDLLALADGNSHRAYYLPWNPDAGFYVDLPATPTGNDPLLFLTANLTGCCVGIQNFGGFIRVRHYNLYTTGNQNPIFSQDDLFRYGTNVSWLLPSDKYNVPAIQRAAPYTHGGPWAEAVLWGEYVATYWPFTSKWHFYYQNGNANKVIHELNYQ
ncbi:hypothetical protein ACNT2N_21410 [Pseudomonas thivervalensis]|uniref:Uncharacterized protein n=1 Tax=Pseudomonas thivervalensis TaxID=86265 RepID=A0A176NIC2_9PSED|nr:hypothetical protein [Pseudomonas thivervalensis]AXA53389.1 hypothetical protein CE140_03135 [Pseudomonas thivervalensis]AXA58975.1 hypothetical protein CEQ51_02450 [Pseudomonas thivervalensis]OAB50902.1 hypothetical protein APS14_07635 [Pseudomonas thivervalensis]SDF41941.1 hypothetical protein SAMN04490204_0655 [Pseudomonas thivervalensis]